MLAKFSTLSQLKIGIIVSAFLFAVLNVSNVSAAPGFATGYKVIPAGFQAQPQWQRIMTTAAARSDVTPWQDVVDEYRGQHPLRQLDAVNRYFNRIPYAEDQKIYGARDYWATPEEFVSRNVGDCEDYSIAKYTALRAMGWSADSLTIVAIRDHKYKVNHAVLAAEVDGQWYFLDNRAQRLLTPRDVPFYQPIYAVNERQLSLFVKARPTLQTAANANTPNTKPGEAG